MKFPAPLHGRLSDSHARSAPTPCSRGTRCEVAPKHLMPSISGLDTTLSCFGLNTIRKAACPSGRRSGRATDGVASPDRTQAATGYRYRGDRRHPPWLLEPLPFAFAHGIGSSLFFL